MRFSQAVSEGDGISVVPVLAGDVAALALAAERAGAEAVAVSALADVEPARAAAGLPVLLREPVRGRGPLEDVRAAGADACVLAFSDLAGDGELLEELSAQALELGLDCALAVADEDELADALERLDPDIVILSEREVGDAEDGLERILDVLPDVPVGKLVIADGHVVAREQVLALERAGVDAIIVPNLAGGSSFSEAVEALAGGPRPGRSSS